MADKKDVLDYLRNQQKAAEIEAKINGVNIWVLLGAIAVVGWQLTSVSTEGRLLGDAELVLRSLVAAVALHWLIWIVGKSDAERDEIRYSRVNFSELISPLVVLLKGLLLLLPPVALILIAGKSVGTFVMAALGLSFVAVGVVAIAKPLLYASPSKDKFPKPDFGLTRRAYLSIDLLLGSLLIVALAEQLGYVYKIVGELSLVDTRQIGLLVVLYLLVLIAVSRKIQNDGIAWTYDLETDLVVGSISPEVAVRRIENRRLGPKLQDVMNRFFDDLDCRFGVLDSMLDQCAAAIGEAREIPEKYSVERAAKMKEASEAVAAHINALVTDCKDFADYLKKLEVKVGGSRKTELAQVIVSLKARYEVYDDRARSAKLELRRLIA